MTLGNLWVGPQPPEACTGPQDPFTWVVVGDFPSSRGLRAAPVGSSPSGPPSEQLSMGGLGMAGMGSRVGRTNHSACCERVLKVARWPFFILSLSNESPSPRSHLRRER